MIYVYDILLNFQPNFYDFYEWNQNDQILHIKKIPLFKVTNKDFLNIKNNIVKFDEEFLTQLNNTATIFKKRKIINNIFLLANDIDIIALKLSKKGQRIQISSLLPEEADDILPICQNIETSTIKYQILKPIDHSNFKTRLEKEQHANINALLNNLYKQKDITKLQFLYLECFGKNENSIEKIIKKLKKEITESETNYDKILSFFNLIKKG